MKDFFGFTFIVIIYLAFRTTVLPSVPIPDLPLIIVFFLSYKRPCLMGLVLAFFLGYTSDVLMGSIIGITSFTLVFVYAANYLVATRFHYDNHLLRAIGCGIATLASGTLAFLILSFINEDVRFFANVVPQTVVTAFFAPFIITLFERGAHIRRPRSQRPEGESF